MIINHSAIKVLRKLQTDHLSFLNNIKTKFWVFLKFLFSVQINRNIVHTQFRVKWGGTNVPVFLCTKSL